jgi:uncharacterized SAM-binding protein YcdF (DUF218 family)
MATFMKPRRSARRALLLIAAAAALLFLGTAIVVDRFGQVERAQKAVVIVVLGARVLDGGAPSGPLRARAEKAVELYRQGMAPALLFSGGVGDNAPAEGVVARAIALDMGVPASACWLEDQSHSTAENAARSAVVLRERGVKTAIVVSDPYHLLRARQYFYREGVDVSMSPALLSERNVHLGARIRWTLREAAALFVHPGLFVARRPVTSAAYTR